MATRSKSAAAASTLPDRLAANQCSDHSNRLARTEHHSPPSKPYSRYMQNHTVWFKVHNYIALFKYSWLSMGATTSNIHKILHCFKSTGLPKSYNGLIYFIYSVQTHMVQVMHVFHYRRGSKTGLQPGASTQL